VAGLQGARVGTVVVDEAHHLRTEWWRTLIAVIRGLDHPTIIALTATPPYDVSPFEWERYEELCGPVSAEISTPELVATGDLCPHQDYIYFSSPSEHEQCSLDEFRRNVQVLLADLCADQDFIKYFVTHPWIRDAQGHIEEILSDPDYFSSMLIFLNHVQQAVSKGLLEVLGTSRQNLPQLNLE